MIEEQELDAFDSREFYELMQRYRWADAVGVSPTDTVKAFEAVKEFCRHQCGQTKDHE